MDRGQIEAVVLLVLGGDSGRFRVLASFFLEDLLCLSLAAKEAAETELTLLLCLRANKVRARLGRGDVELVQEIDIRLQPRSLVLGVVDTLESIQLGRHACNGIARSKNNNNNNNNKNGYGSRRLVRE